MFEKTSENITTVIGQGVKLEGDFTGSGDVEFYGDIKGSITISGFIRVGGNAHVTANITADRAEIAGHVKGKINTNTDVDILATAKVMGDVKSQQITIAKGAHISGKITTDTAPSGRGVKTKIAPVDDTVEN
jgi:cytoskeletal protein CcmA (bactofilin family)